MTDTEQAQDLGYEETLSYTQRKRRAIVEHIMFENTVPSDEKQLNIVLKALADMDRSALDKQKNSIDQGAADSSRQVAEAMVEFISLQKNRNPFERTAEDKYEGVIPEIEQDRLGEFEIVPGETEIGVITESADEFIKRMSAQRMAELEADDQDPTE